MSLISPPCSGVEVRMYRAGHGDFFLLTFRRSVSDDTPFFMLIDCGMKGGSHVEEDRSLHDVIGDLHAHTGGVLDLVVVTHEHQDHVSGFPKPGEDDHPFHKLGFVIKELWLGWTEDETDEDANRFREIYGDQVLTLALAHHKLSEALGADDEQAKEIAEFLEIETGHTDGASLLTEVHAELDAAGELPLGLEGDPFGAVFAASSKIKGERYKRRLQGLRHMAEKITFLSPGDGPLALPGVTDVRVYPFGPPRDKKRLTSLNPRKSEEFHVGPFALGTPGADLFAAMTSASGAQGSGSPFAPRYTIPEADILERTPRKGSDPKGYYLARAYKARKHENRRIDGDWLGDAEALALRINNEVNNTSLVLAFELMQSGQTLLFTGDAQRGSWVSWAELSWTVDGHTVTAKDLLARCTFYKAGHHGSHNATLNGTLEDEHANLNWMAQGKYADHFVSMIPTNKVWAFGKSRPWRHPMKAIEDALFEKAKSRVMMIKVDKVQKTAPKEQWLEKHKSYAFAAMREEFENRTEYAETYVSHIVPDKPL